MSHRKSGLSLDEIAELAISIQPDLSDIEDFDENKDEEVVNEDDIVPSAQGEISDPESDSVCHDDEVDAAAAADISEARRKERWLHKSEFTPHRVPPRPAGVSEVKQPFEYFSEYLKPSFFEDMATYTNMRYVSITGNSMSCTAVEMRKFWGASIIVALLGYPRLRMSWETKTRFPLIADNITRDRFYLIRKNLKVVDDNSVSAEKKKDSFWKVRPMLEQVRGACLSHSRPNEISIDEQMIPFHGRAVMRQYVKGKPHPVGLKNFVMATPKGLPLDFYLYEGKGKEIIAEKTPMPEKIDIGGRIVLKFADTVPAHTSLYFDRYFTSVTLLDYLLQHRSILASGTIMMNRIPKRVEFKKDSLLRKEGRGSHDQMVRGDDMIALVKWYDNKPIHLASSEFGVDPVESCRRWSKKDSKHIDIPRPHVVKAYNSNMGGVDLLDRVLAKYAMRARTKKWTIRTLYHFFDFSVAAAWIQYRIDAEQCGWRKNQIMSYYMFRLDIAEHLILSKSEERLSDDADEDIEEEDYSRSSKRQRVPKELPSPQSRYDHAQHLPEIMNEKQNTRSKCRASGCKGLTFVQCTKCKVFLCLTSQRNCFLKFHKK